MEFGFSAPHIRRKTGGVLQFSVCFRERQGKSFMFAFLFSFYSHWLNHSNFFSFLSYLILSLFISPRSSFTSRLNAVSCHIEVETNFTCVFLTIADASICQVFESHVSSLARSYDRKKKLTLKKHGPRIKLTCDGAYSFGSEFFLKQETVSFSWLYCLCLSDAGE